MTAFHTDLPAPETWPSAVTMSITGNYRTVCEFDLCSGLWVAYHPALDGCIAQGETVQEALNALPDVRAMYLEHLRAHGLFVPPVDVP